MSFFWPPKSSQHTRNLQANSYLTRLLFMLQHHCLLLDVERPFCGAQNFWVQYCTKKNNQRNSETFKIARKHSFRNCRLIVNPSPLTLHQASRCRRNVLNVCHRWSGSVGTGGVSQMPFQLKLGANLSDLRLPFKSKQGTRFLFCQVVSWDVFFFVRTQLCEMMQFVQF